MNNGFIVIMFIGYIVTGQPMQQEQPITEIQPQVAQNVLAKQPNPEVEMPYCSACYESIPDSHSHFMQDPDHLVCIHCYFYRMPKTEEGQVGLALEYVGKNGMELRDK